MPKLTRKFPTTEKTTTIEGNREYRKLQQKEFRERKAAKDKAAKGTLEFWNESSGKAQTKKDYDNLIKKIEIQDAVDKNRLSSIINNNYVFTRIDSAWKCLYDLNRILVKDNIDSKNDAEFIKERILVSQVKAYRYGIEESEVLNVICQTNLILNNPDLTPDQKVEQIRNIPLSEELISKSKRLKLNKLEDKKTNE